MSLLDRVQQRAAQEGGAAAPQAPPPPAQAPAAPAQTEAPLTSPGVQKVANGSWALQPVAPMPSQGPPGYPPAPAPMPQYPAGPPAQPPAAAPAENQFHAATPQAPPFQGAPPPQAPPLFNRPAAPPAGRTLAPADPNRPASLLTRTAASRPAGAGPARTSSYSVIRGEVHQRLVEELAGNTDGLPPDEIRRRLAELVADVVTEKNLTMTRNDKQRMVEQIIHDVLGLGPLETLLADAGITEVMINGPDQIYIEQKGKLSLSSVTFENNEQLMQVIDRIVSSIGRRVDESSPMVDARLKDGSRVNVIIPPLALRGPTVTIRKFAKEAFTIDDLVSFGTISEDMVAFLRACVRARLNVVVSGGTGSGKTTTLNILSGFIPEEERIVTIEDAAELQLRQEHVITLESRPANVEGRGRIAIRDLVMNSLRMRPDRIVVGECRGGEALDMLQAMNTGHDGSLTTLHANNPHECIGRLETMVLMAGADLPSRAIREQIGAAVNLIVQQSRLRDGTRKVVSITEVLGIEGDELKLQEIFTFRQTGVDPDTGKVLGYLTPTGVIPHYMEHLKAEGEAVPEALFRPVNPNVAYIAS